MDGNGVNFLFHDDWVWDFDWDFNWVWDFDFFNDWDFDYFVFWDFLVVMFVDSMDRDFNTANMVFMTIEWNLSLLQNSLLALNELTRHHDLLELR